MHAGVDDRLSKRLAGLPSIDGGAAGWQAVQHKLRQRERAVVRRRQAARLSLAAGVVVLSSLAAWNVAQRRAEPGVSATIAATPRAPVPAASELQQLRARSMALEAVLAAMPARPTVVRADSAWPIDTLEAQVQWLDHQLSVGEGAGAAPKEEAQLWRERVEVMNSLVQLRYAEAQRVAM
jgi:hypothetical protein